MNLGFSSTEGILIYTGKFSQVTYDAASGTAAIGSGLIWDDVYQQLQEHNITVLGGRITGVSGCDSSGWCNLNPIANRLALAASYSVEVGPWRVSLLLNTDASRTGYSYKTNQYGLALDTIVGFDLVLPNGTVACVTQSTHPDLFFGLKGGFNNIVSFLPQHHRRRVALTGFQGIVTDFTMTAFPQTDVWVRTVLFVIVHRQSANFYFRAG